MHTSTWVVNQKVEAGNGEIFVTLREPVSDQVSHPPLHSGKRVTLQMPAADAAPMEPGTSYVLTLAPVSPPDVGA